MDDLAVDGGAFAETIVFLSYFKDLPDVRQRGKVMYPLAEVLLLCLLAVLAGAETVTDIARFGEKKLDLLRRLRRFAAGTPAHDHLGDILATLDAEAFQRCFVAWVAALIGVPEGVVAIDGKTVRRSKGAAKDAIHMVSAFAARQRLVLGQVKVADKANEIVAIPKLLDMLAIEGAVVTIDAMGCQRAIAQKIVDKNADYILALKGNQGSLRDDVELFATEQKANDFKDTTVSRHQTVDGDHGRVETRDITVIHDVGWLQERHNWPAMASFVMVQSTRVIPGPTRDADKIEHETRFYITSLKPDAERLNRAIRQRWSIENNLHWVLDVGFGEDLNRNRAGHSAQSFFTLNRIALNILKHDKSSKRESKKTAHRRMEPPIPPQTTGI